MVDKVLFDQAVKKEEKASNTHINNDDVKDDIKDLKAHNEKAIHVEPGKFENTVKPVSKSKYTNDLFEQGKFVGKGRFGGFDARAGYRKADPTSVVFEPIFGNKRKLLKQIPGTSKETLRLAENQPNLRTKDTNIEKNCLRRYNLDELAVSQRKSLIRGHKGVSRGWVAPMHLSPNGFVPRTNKDPDYDDKEEEESNVPDNIKEDPEFDIDPDTIDAIASESKFGKQAKIPDTTEGQKQQVLEKAPDSYSGTTNKAMGNSTAGYSNGGYRGLRATVKRPA